MNERVSVIVPVCNERENTGPFCHALSCVRERSGEDAELIFVGDGSTTSQAARPFLD